MENPEVVLVMVFIKIMHFPVPGHSGYLSGYIDVEEEPPYMIYTGFLLNRSGHKEANGIFHVEIYI